MELLQRRLELHVTPDAEVDVVLLLNVLDEFVTAHTAHQMIRDVARSASGHSRIVLRSSARWLVAHNVLGNIRE